MMKQIIERCEGCRKICLCHGECVCMAITKVHNLWHLYCHACTDRYAA